MTAEKKQRLPKKPCGVGEVWRGEERMTRVPYLLDVHQKILLAETLTQTERIMGLKSMTGSISVLEGSKYR